MADPTPVTNTLARSQRAAAVAAPRKPSPAPRELVSERVARENRDADAWARKYRSTFEPVDELEQDELGG